MSSIAQENSASGKGLERPDDVPETALLNYPQMRGISLVFVLMGIMMHTIDSTIANVALPHMQGSLSATVDQISWVITGYIVAAAIGTPAVAWLCARYGLKRVLLLSVAFFTLTSILCGIAVTLEDMVVYRILQGLSGAALIPVGQKVVLSTFKPEEYGKAMGLFGLGVMFGPIIGPTLGGYITEWANWRWVFFVNLPFGLLSMAGIWFFVKEAPKSDQLYFDKLGFFSLVTALVSFQLLMDRGHTEDWFDSWEIISLAALSISGLYVFIVRTITADDPFFSRALFTDRNFVVGNIVFFFIGGNMVVTMMMVPVVMQSLLGYPVATAGLLLAPRGLGMMISFMLVPRLAAKYDSRLLISIGLCITSFALFDQAQMGNFFTAWGFIRSGFVHGIGLGMVFVLLGALTFSHMADEIQLEASTFFNMIRNIGQSFCAAIAMSAIARNIQINSAELGESINALEQNLRLATLGMSNIPPQELSLALLQGGIMKQAMSIAFVNNFSVLAMATLFLIPVIWVTKKKEAT